MKDKSKIIAAIIFIFWGGLLTYETFKNAGPGGISVLKNIFERGSKGEPSSQILVFSAIVFLIQIFFWIFIPLLISSLLIRSVIKNKKQEKKMKEAYAEYEKDKKREDFEGYYKKKIVRCEFCGKQSRYGNGKCPHCGGVLPKIHAKENEN